MGAFPYTNRRLKWREILLLKEDLPDLARLWTPLTKAFQTLEFKFLNNVDAEFAVSLRADGRLSGFRRFIRNVWTTANKSDDLGQIEAATESFRATLARNPNDAEATVMLGRCLSKSAPRPGDPRSDGQERLKLNYEETAYRQLQAELGVKE